VEYRAVGRSAILAPMDPTRPLIAVLDDEPQFCKALARLLKTHAFDVITFTRGDAFLAHCASQSPPSALLLDLHMPNLSGFEILERIAAQRIPSFVITGHDEPGNAERVRALGAIDYFLKPVNESQLIEAIHTAVDQPAPTMPSDSPRPKQ
jgi:FixJ family two-component response regulator